MEDPQKSNSVQDFWKRWNFAIRIKLVVWVYVPIIKSKKFSRNFAVFSTFFISGLIHSIAEYLNNKSILLSLSIMPLFFLQPFIILLEKKL